MTVTPQTENFNNRNGATLISAPKSFADEIWTVERKPESSVWEDEYPIISSHWGDLRHG